LQYKKERNEYAYAGTGYSGDIIYRGTAEKPGERNCPAN
jgi:hypothetical protein